MAYSNYLLSMSSADSGAPRIKAEELVIQPRDETQLLRLDYSRLSGAFRTFPQAAFCRLFRFPVNSVSKVFFFLL